MVFTSLNPCWSGAHSVVQPGLELTGLELAAIFTASSLDAETAGFRLQCVAILVFRSRAPERQVCLILRPEAATLPVLPRYLPGEELRARVARVPALVLGLPNSSSETRSHAAPFFVS